MDEDPNVLEIRSILLRHIAELEAAMQRTAELAAGAAPRATFRQANGNDRNVTKVLWTALFESR